MILQMMQGRVEASGDCVLGGLVCLISKLVRVKAGGRQSFMHGCHCNGSVVIEATDGGGRGAWEYC